jgi:hypothetical protein
MPPVTPYTAAINAASDRCNTGDQSACNSITPLVQAQAGYQAQVDARAQQDHMTLMGMGNYYAARAAAMQSYAPPVYAPRYVNCNSFAFGSRLQTRCY